MKIRIYNNTLNPAFWNSDNTLKPEIREALLKIAQDFYEDTELTAPIEDIYMHFDLIGLGDSDTNSDLLAIYTKATVTRMKSQRDLLVESNKKTINEFIIYRIACCCNELNLREYFTV